MDTEDVSPRFLNLDAWSATEVVEAMWEGQISAVAVVRQALPAIAVAIEAAAEALGEAGRLVYVGAGTSGRVAIQDGAELPPTFDWPSKRLVFLMAGGRDALTSSAEGAEDDAVEAERLIAEAGIGARDVVIGVAASGATPFTVAATQAATRRGAVTIGIANNAGAPLLAAARHPILIETGHEVIAGSTRMQAGTAQKVVLNIISSGIMVRLGRVYGGMMVNMHPTNAKLRHRAELMVARIAGCEPGTASQALDRSQGDIKIASLVALGLDAEAASASLARHGGNLRKALTELTGKEAP